MFMRKIIHIILGCLFLTALNAQTPACVADVRYKDSAAGPYPLPYVAATNPNGGIDKVACLGKPYTFTFTIKVGDSISVPVLGTTLTLPLDSIVLKKTTGITGLPTGLSYACFPASCVFPKRTLGCAIITGTTATSNALKDYSLQINGQVYTYLTPNGYDVTFPGSLFPGEYKLKVVAATDAKCTTSSVNDLNSEISSMTTYPNPVSSKAEIRVESNISSTYDFDVYNLVGHRVIHYPLSIQAGSNIMKLNTENLPNGIYIYSLSKGNKLMTNKFVVNK
jgi:Secretion system C-terminal sorting domain